MKLAKIQLSLAIAMIVAGTSASGAQETVLYSLGFCCSGNGGSSGLAVDKNGNLYGAYSTAGGDTPGIFEVTHQQNGTWIGSSIFTFTDGSHLSNYLAFSPNGVTVDPEGNLYGITADVCGYAFELTPEGGGKWSEKKIFTLGASDADACLSLGGLILDSNGNLYGTSFSGGDTKNGTVFELMREPNGGWSEKVLYSFAGAPSDGNSPEAGLIFDSNGNLYGTTSNGGQYSGGTVFELIPQPNGDWSEKVLHNFCPLCQDAYYSVSGLTLDKKGNLFGATLNGGGTGSSGAVFELSPEQDGAWNETVLHGFSSNDGAEPNGGLVIDQRGNVYGTTLFGGINQLGIVFELSPGENGIWTEKVIHQFGDQVLDGWQPQAGLVSDDQGTLYGTTKGGGYWSDGTVYEIANPDITAVPQLSFGSGTYPSPVTVSITDYTPGAAIYYTINGDNPTTDSARYKDPIRVTENETIKAVAVADGLSNSTIVTAEYKIAAAVPEFSLKPRTYDAVQFVTLTDKTSPSSIYYTTNGETPTRSSARYTEPIRVGKTETIKAIAFAYDHAPSAEATASYTIHLPAGRPVFSPPPGNFASAITVHVSDATPGATIYYTTNGETPTASSTKYTPAGIRISQSETIKAIATAPNRSPSIVRIGGYTIK
jgi:uncharacterized repeat protein (TIGR03803 family)